MIQPVCLPEAKGEALSESKTINNKKKKRECGQHRAGEGGGGKQVNPRDISSLQTPTAFKGGLLNPPSPLQDTEAWSALLCRSGKLKLLLQFISAHPASLEGGQSPPQPGCDFPMPRGSTTPYTRLHSWHLWLEVGRRWWCRGESQAAPSCCWAMHMCWEGH